MKIPYTSSMHLGRRSFLKRSSSSLGAAILGGAVLSDNRPLKADVSPADSDLKMLNFALNLEYLEAEFYARALEGAGIADLGIDVSGFGTLGTTTIKSGNTKVKFSSIGLRKFVQEIAGDERAHVNTLRESIKSLGGEPAAFPAINLQESFTDMAIAAGLIVSGQSFNPFSHQQNFLLGAFYFGDVVVTAYFGAVKTLTRQTLVDDAAGILAVEAGHAAIIRQQIDVTNGGKVANLIAALRSGLDGTPDNERGLIGTDKSVTLIPTSTAGLILSRTAPDVLQILCGGQNATSGLFFPQGMNLPS